MRRLRSRLTRPADARLERILNEVRLAQGMAARAYEAALGWPAILAAIRSDDRYDHAFSGDPLISVRIATYNRAEVLTERTLPSVMRQSYPNWEAVVVGEACTDDTEARIRGLGDDRIRFVNLPFRPAYPQDPQLAWRVSGVAPMNAGMQLARGEWIAPLDDDDEFDDDHLEVLLRHAQTNRAEVAYGQWRVIDTRTGALTDAVALSWPPEEGRFNFLTSLLHAGLKQFAYDPNSYLAGEVSDWNLARRLWQAGVRFSFLDRVVATYYLRPRTWHT